MRKDQVHVGHTYVAKISDKLTRVRLTGANPHGGWDAINLATNKKVRIKSPAKLRGPASDTSEARDQARATAAADQENARLRDERNASPDGQTLSERAMSASAGKKKSAKTAEEKAKRPSGLNAAVQVLKDKGEPMRCKDMVDTMLAKGMWKTDGKTPAATIYSAILREIQTKGTESRFKKTDRGLFTVNAQ